MEKKSLLRSWAMGPFVVMCVLIGLGMSGPSGSSASGRDDASRLEVASAKLTLDAEQRQAQSFISTLQSTLGDKIPADIIGPLAPVALSPFFALTCLSGASLLADSGLLPDRLAKSAVVNSSSPLRNGTVFVGLLALTLLTAAPKLTKVTKPLAMAADQLENYSGIVAVMAVQFLSQVNLGESAVVSGDAVAQAGLVDATVGYVLMAFSAINLFVINTVKFFFETLTWLSPFPMVDAVFEAMNKGFAAFLLGVYMFNPMLAMAINLVLFLICLMIFGWIHRRAVFFRMALGDPLFGWIGRLLFFRKRATAKSTRVPRSIIKELGEPSLALLAFSSRRMKGVPSKARGYLIEASDRAYFIRLRFLRSPIIVEIPDHTGRVLVKRGLLSHSVVFHPDTTGETRFQITRRYSAALPEIERILRSPEVSQSAPVGEGLKAMRSAMKSANADDLRAEMA